MALKAGRPTGRTKQHIEKVKATLVDDESKELFVKEFTSEYHELQCKVKILEDENAAIRSELEALNLKFAEQEKNTSKAPAGIWWWDWFQYPPFSTNNPD